MRIPGVEVAESAMFRKRTPRHWQQRLFFQDGPQVDGDLGSLSSKHNRTSLLPGVRSEDGSVTTGSQPDFPPRRIAGRVERVGRVNPPSIATGERCIACNL